MITLRSVLRCFGGLSFLCPGAISQQQINFFAPSPSPPLVVTATANSPVGFSSLCYWVVANYPIGKSTPSNPSCIPNGNTASTVLVSWTPMLGATNYDVLRTATAGLPAGASNIAVATAVSGTTQTDSFGALSSYTISSASSATATIILDNLNHSSAGLYQSLNGAAFSALVTTAGGATNIFNNVTNTYTNVTQTFTSSTNTYTNVTNTYITGTDDFSGDSHVTPHPVGAGASKPATCKVGEEYYENDAAAGANLDLCTSTNVWTTGVTAGAGSFSPPYIVSGGTTFWPAMGITVTPPPAIGSWTWVNQGTATTANQNGALVVKYTGESGDNVHAFYVTAPSTPYTRTGCIHGGVWGQNAGGMVLRNSSSGSLIGWWNTSSGITAQKFNNPTSFNANYNPVVNTPGSIFGRPMCFQINDTGTNRNFNVSFDGINFVTVLTTTSSDFITPNQIGFGVNPHDTGAPANQTIMITSYQ